MLCAISGEAPQVPVASSKSGNVFEKRLIEAHIAEHHTDPVTGEELAVEDLIALQSPRVVRPRPPTLTSIPALLTAFQTEWDAIALETFRLKQHLTQTRQELSTALYQNDAATLALAKALRENEQLRDALSNVTLSDGAARNGDAHAQAQELPSELAEVVDDTQQRLQSTRRKRAIPDGWADAELIGSFESLDTSPSLCPDSTALAVDESGDQVLFGGAHGSASVYALSKSEVVQTFKCGNAVTAVAWCGARAVVGTSSGAVRVFEEGAEATQLGCHVGAVTSIAVHPSRTLLASASKDKTFMYYDLSTMKQVAQVYTDVTLLCCCFHPDGHLLATGGPDGGIRLFDVKAGSIMATFEAEGGGPVTSLAFSENGIWLASAVDGSTSVAIWDLRKMATVKTLEIESAVRCVRWDYTGQFLVAAGPHCVSVQAYAKASKSWSEPFRKAVATADVAWGVRATSLVVLNPEGGLTVLRSMDAA